MKSEIITIPAVTKEVTRTITETVEVSPAHPVLRLDLNGEEAAYLRAVLGARAGTHDGPYYAASYQIFRACGDFMESRNSSYNHTQYGALKRREDRALELTRNVNFED